MNEQPKNIQEFKNKIYNVYFLYSQRVKEQCSLIQNKYANTQKLEIKEQYKKNIEAELIKSVNEIEKIANNLMQQVSYFDKLPSDLIKAEGEKLSN